MIFGVGVDLVEAIRIQESLHKFQEQFERKVFTAEELAHCDTMAVPAIHLAARFAAKEAFLKALGTGKSEGIGWQDVGVVRAPNGKPSLVITGRAKALCDEAKICGMYLSMTHTDTHAVAVVVLETKD